MITGSPSEGSIDFQDHPEGKKFEGIVYCFRNLGLKPNTYGNKPKEKYMVRVESMTEFMEPEEIDGETVVRPFSAPIFVNKSWGDPKSRTGTKFPKLQRLREEILGRDLEDEEWYSFDPDTEFKYVRVVYNVRHTPNDNGGKPFVDVEIRDRMEDQTKGEPFNDWICEEEFVDKRGKGSSGAPPPAPAGGSNPDRDAFLQGIVKLNSGKFLADDDFKQWKEWASTASASELPAQYKQFEALAKENAISIPAVGEIPF